MIDSHSSAGQGLDLVAFWRARVRGARDGRPALHGALLVHARPGVAADHQPLQRGHAGVAARVARRGVLRGRRQPARRRRALRRAGSRRCTRPPAAIRRAARGGRRTWRVRRRPGDDRRAAHAIAAPCGARSASTASRARRCSTPTEQGVRRGGRARCWPRVRGARCSSARPTDPEGPDGTRPGRPHGELAESSRRRRASSAGWRSCPTATGTPAHCRRRCWRSPDRRLRQADRPDEPGEVAVARVLSRSGAGSSCTARRS